MSDSWGAPEQHAANSGAASYNTGSTPTPFGADQAPPQAGYQNPAQHGSYPQAPNQAAAPTQQAAYPQGQYPPAQSPQAQYLPAQYPPAQSQQTQYQQTEYQQPQNQGASYYQGVNQPATFQQGPPSASWQYPLSQQANPQAAYPFPLDPRGYPAPQPEKNRNAWMIGLILLLGTALVVLLLVMNRGEAVGGFDRQTIDPPTIYQNDDYVAPDPTENPPALVIPRTAEEANQLLTANPLYNETVPRPIRCEISDINPSTADWKQMQTHADEVTACLMKEWAGVLEAAGYQASRPTVTLYDKEVDSKCGPIPSYNASWCSADQQVYYAPDIIERMPAQVTTSRLMMDVILAHEFGHAIQGRTGIYAAARAASSSTTKDKAYEIQRRAELQADCMAGLYIGSLITYMKITDDEVETVKALLTSGGDDNVKGGDDSEPGGHGRGVNRNHWVTVGLEASPAKVGACNTWIAPSDLVS